ncbi:hypothetical protein UFOVP514_39 [uncultured Caudovirales phage]|uniref:PD-(D/E)XK nuclease superfamily n=1 Tax=uncultured Caudovirales phage TaxID=2100421 RepID=A0A6J5MPM6_9CAUD|nr:hypothetical protein UFOVP514_39 [uncultured Caudovirales phage]
MKEFKIRASQIGKIMGNAKAKGELSAVCTTYLKEWYAEKLYCDTEEIRSKYFDKGNLQENEAIEEVVSKFDLGLGFKNLTFFENDYMTGTPDLLTETTVYDTKCSWNGKTFLSSVTSPIDSNYEWQLLGYMELTKRRESKLCYLLLNTPEESNYGNEVIYDNIPMNLRFSYFDVYYSEEKIKAIEDKVIKCREWLSEYDSLVKSLLS